MDAIAEQNQSPSEATDVVVQYEPRPVLETTHVVVEYEQTAADTADRDDITVREPEPHRVHPYAAQFPMMDDDALALLADDIRSNGLLMPIVIDQTGQLLDGRNRLKACGLADVEPVFSTVADVDPVAYIVSANVTRRHLTQGQTAMFYARAYPEATDKGGRGHKTTISKIGVSADYITKARFVLHHAPDLVAKVMAGSSLPEAYGLAVEEKRDQEEFEQLRHDVRDHLDSLAEVCMRIKASTDRPDAFLDRADFYRTLHAAGEQIKEQASYFTAMK